MAAYQLVDRKVFQRNFAKSYTSFREFSLQIHTSMREFFVNFKDTQTWGISPYFPSLGMATYLERAFLFSLSKAVCWLLIHPIWIEFIRYHFQHQHITRNGKFHSENSMTLHVLPVCRDLAMVAPGTVSVPVLQSKMGIVRVLMKLFLPDCHSIIKIIWIDTSSCYGRTIASDVPRYTNGFPIAREFLRRSNYSLVL